jgi:site-specific recombinase XerD
MFDQLFETPFAVRRHLAGPLAKERLAFLGKLADRGISRKTLRGYAPKLLVFIDTFALVCRPKRIITRDEINRKTGDHRVRSLVARWLRFLGRLEHRSVPVSPYAAKIKAFTDYMERERGLSPVTVRNRCWLIPRLLGRLGSSGGSLREITPHQIDESLQATVRQGDYARTTIQNWAGELRAFFRYAETQGWCRPGLAACIRGPRLFAQSSLPTGPSWDDVRRLLVLTEGDRPADIRDRAILLLLAIYGLRAGEVNRLRLEDFNWERELFTVTSSKTQRPRTYPLVRSVGDAVLRYVREVRPRSPHRELFLTLLAPIRPLRGALGAIVATRLRSLNLSLRHYGPHALRHACAARLLAEGLSLKEIGDHLGHVDPEATRIYAKVDLVGLRQVADFELGDLP